MWITLLSWTPVPEWYIIWQGFVLQNGHQKDMHYIEIPMCPQTIDTINTTVWSLGENGNLHFDPFVILHLYFDWETWIDDMDDSHWLTWWDNSRFDPTIMIVAQTFTKIVKLCYGERWWIPYRDRCVHSGLVAFTGSFSNATCQFIDSLCNPCMSTRENDDHKFLQVEREFRIAKKTLTHSVKAAAGLNLLGVMCEPLCGKSATSQTNQAFGIHFTHSAVMACKLLLLFGPTSIAWEPLDNHCPVHSARI